MSTPDKMDRICLRGLQVEAIIGLFDWERKVRQTLILDLELGVDLSQAGHSDDIQDTVNYKTLAEQVRTFVQESRYQLVEALAEAIAKLILDQFPVIWLRLEINKQCALREVRKVGIIIERRQES